MYYMIKNEFPDALRRVALNYSTAWGGERRAAEYLGG